MTYFDRLELRNWRHFEEINIDLSRQVTVITGANGAGKTTVLRVLARHFGWNINFISTPFSSKLKKRKFWSDVRRSRSVDQVGQPNSAIQVGTIRYSDGQECPLHTTREVGGPQYQLQYGNQKPVTGLHIPSHRPVASYHNVNNIPTDPKTIEQQYQEFQQLLFQTYGSETVRNPATAQKRSLISLALFGYGNEAVVPNPEYRGMFEGFQEVLKKVLPPELGFERLEIRMPEVVLVTSSGEFALESMSGGINALFGIAWQIFMYAAGRKECTVTIDEPENHLHPRMQRSLLPNLAEAFPHIRFVIATHSPFIVSSFPESSVYGLAFNDDRRVECHHLGTSDLSGTPNSILREILDVPSNLPVWVEKRVLEAFAASADELPAERGAKLLALLSELGIADALPDLKLED